MSQHSYETSIDKSNDAFSLALNKFKNKTAKVAVVGLGYVGLPLINTLSKNSYPVIGFDIDKRRVDILNSGKSFIKSVSDEDVKAIVTSTKYEFTTDPKCFENADAILICVPTPLTKNREPDMKYVKASVTTVAKHAKKGQLVILESTTYPGTTTELMQPILEEAGFKVGQDIFLAYSPEREDPGNPDFSTSSIPKVVGADCKMANELAMTLYRNLVPSVVSVSSAATAEAVKLTENIFRFVNISLMNELKIVFEKMDIDIWEVIDAAKTKPFGFMPFYPGPGIGGHCIPIDPFYLTWKAREYACPTRFVELSGEIMNAMPQFIVTRLREELDERFSIGIRGANILVLGVAYKANVEDLRESPALGIYKSLLDRKANVEYFDPYCKDMSDAHEFPELRDIKSLPELPQNLDKYDAVLVLTHHDNINYLSVAERAKFVLDTRNSIPSTLGMENVAKA